jgi:hypothetical protein
MTKEISTKESPVMTVATYEGWIENPDQAGSDTFDWAHPNERGQAKLADKWFAAMKPLLTGFTGAPTSTQAASVPATTAAKSSWAFTPSRDTFSPTAFFDMRSLNEKVAGQSGFVTLNKEGHFVRGDGQPLRFWGVVSDNQKPIGEGSDQEPRNWRITRDGWPSAASTSCALWSTSRRARAKAGARPTATTRTTSTAKTRRRVALRRGDEERRHLLADLSLLGAHRQAAQRAGALMFPKAKTRTTCSISIRKCAPL